MSVILTDDTREIDKLLTELDEQLDEKSTKMLIDLMQDNKGNELEVLRTLMNYTYKWDPVGVREFIESEEYLGRQGEVYPALLSDLTELFSGDYIEAVLTGAIGWGKSTFAELALVRMIYEVSCLRNPQKAFGLMRGSVIAFINVSVNKENAKKVVFQGIKSNVIDSPYFSERFPLKAEKAEELKFPEKVWVFPAAAGESGIIGYNVFGGVMDEVNFMAVTDNSKNAAGGHFDQALTLQEALIRRMKSRFMKRGKLPGILIQISSSKYPEDYTERRIKEAKELERSPNKTNDIFYRRYSQWDTLPSDKYSGEKFKISLGDSVQPSEILETEEDVERAKENGMEMLEVPIEYYRDFDKDIDAAIRDLAGRPTLTIAPYLSNRAAIYEAMERGKKEQMPIVHPFTKEYTTLQDGASFDLRKLRLPALQGYIEELEDKKHLDAEEKEKLEKYRKQYKYLKGRKRFLHIDLGITGDSAGIAMGYVKDYQEVIRRNSNGDEFIEKAPIVVIEFMLEIRPPKHDEIQIADVRALVFELVSYGYRVSKVTYDQFQSRESRQQLKRRGIQSEHLSADTNPEVYGSLKEALYEDRVIMYQYNKAYTELVKLEQNQEKNKVDHPPGGSKDVADAIASVCYHCTQAEKTAPPPPPSMGKLYTDNEEKPEQKEFKMPIITN